MKNPIDVYRPQGPFKLAPYERKTYYYETDQMGCIHHSNYIRWMEEARIDLMSQCGMSYQAMEAMEVFCPVLTVEAKYCSMVHFGDTVLIQCHMVKYNGIKMELEYEITDKETGELRTTGRSTHCFLDRNGKPISLKRAYPEIDTKFFEFKEDN